MINAFKEYVDGIAWPEEIAHLKGKILVRKKDRNKFRISRESGQCIGRKPAAYLSPVGDAWPDITRSHWKTYTKILTDFEVQQ